MIRVVGCMLGERGIDIGALAQQAGLPDVTADTAEVVAPLARVAAFIDAAAEALQAPLFGLDLARQIPTGAFGMTEFVMRSARNVENAMRVLAELGPLINPSIDFTVKTREDGASFQFAVPSQRDALGRHLNEYTLALFRRQFGAVLGVELPLHAAWFAHASHDHAPQVSERLGCSVTFGAPDCGLALTTDWLTRSPPTADPALFDFLVGQARSQLATVAPSDFVTELSRVIESHLAGGEVGGADIARAMGLTLRTLQRHLADAGTSYRAVLRLVRLRVHAQLAQAGLDAGDIARRLGFASVTTMRRSLEEDDDGE
jgi:AraC-like DNA-binding protein